MAVPTATENSHWVYCHGIRDLLQFALISKQSALIVLWSVGLKTRRHYAVENETANYIDWKPQQDRCYRKPYAFQTDKVTNAQVDAKRNEPKEP